MQAARRSPRSVAVDEIQQEVGLPHVTNADLEREALASSGIAVSAAAAGAGDGAGH